MKENIESEKSGINSEARKKFILDTACSLFLKNGYGRTTMSAIAEMVGGSKSTLWKYFPSKEILFESVIHHAVSIFHVDLIAALDGNLSTDTDLIKFCQIFIRKISGIDAITLHRIVIGESSQFPELGRIFYAHAWGLIHKILTGYISGQMNGGALRKGDPAKAAGMLLGLCEGGHHKRVLWGIEPYTDAIATEEAASVVEQFMRAYSSVSICRAKL